MDIKIGRYQITASDSQYTVSENRTVKTGDNAGSETRSNQTYHSSIESALENILKRKVRESDATTLEQLRRDVHDAVAWLKEQFQPIAPVNIGRYSFDAAWDEAHGDAA